MQTIFFPDLNELCRAYLDATKTVSPADAASAVSRFKAMEATLFEQVLLFDTVAFKVHGENIPLAFLLNVFGERSFEVLLEQGAFQFVLWTPFVGSMETEAPGVHPICSGNLSSPAHCNPEVSIDQGLNWLSKKPSAAFRRHWVRKLGPNYIVPDDSLAGRAVDITKAAYQSDKLNALGLSPKLAPLENMAKDQRHLLRDCAAQLLEYYFLIGQEMGSYSNFRYFDLFSTSVRRIRETGKAALKFNELAKVEGIPDLKALYPQVRDPLKRLPTFRKSRNARKFREWLAQTGGGEVQGDITREYIADIADANGILDSAGGKFTKSVLMTAAGVGAGALIEASALGAVAGGVAGKVLESVADLGLDLLDNFLLDGLLKGWSPRMYFDDLKKWSNK